MTRIFLIFLTALLTACSSGIPNLNHSQTPILNVEATTVKVAKVDLSANQAEVKNLTAAPLALAYAVFWYDKLGVTSDGQDTPRWQSLNLAAQQKQILPMTAPNSESQNYRFYLRLK